MGAAESKPSAAVGEGGQEGKVEGEEEEDRGKEEDKAEEKANLAGERQSGDGQVRRSPFLTVRFRSDTYGSVLSARSPQTNPRPRLRENRASSWMTMRTGKTPPTSPGRGCSSSTMCADPPRRRRGMPPPPPPHQVPTAQNRRLQLLSLRRPKGRNRKLWKDEGRWEHDRFREEEQAPKSREELIAIYGYDIRNGAGPAYRRQPR